MRVLLVLALLLVAGCAAPTATRDATRTPDAALSAPPPPPPPAEGQVALHVGDAWTWQVAANGTTTRETARVVSVEDGVVTVDRETSRGTLRTTMDASTLAIRSLQQASGAFAGSAAFDPPLPTVIPAADHAWTGVLTLRTPLGAMSQTARATVRFLGLDPQRVPAGELACYHYVVEVQSDGSPRVHQSLDVWYAPAAKAYALTRSDNRTEALASYAVAT